MPVYDAADVPDTVGRGTLDPELAAWLPSGPTLGGDAPIAQGRRDHMQLGVGPRPSVGAVDTLVLPGPHGSITVRRHAASSPASSPSGALVYIHGGGFTYGTLDEFEVPMRLIAERAGILTYIVEYQLAPEAAVHDPRTATWDIARAGHPLPAIACPGQRTAFPDLPPGLPLGTGLGGGQYQTARLHLPPGSTLVLYTDGLIESRAGDMDTGMARLARTLQAISLLPVTQACDALLATLAPNPADDIAIVMART
jgi:Stage II sporulation protein E (SpoIIE)/alpha/beta hydrolase fold